MITQYIVLAVAELIDGSSLPQPTADQHNLQIALNIAFSIIGAIALLIIVLAGMRHVFARDNPENISKARNTIAYAAIGLVITALSAAIVNLIIGRLGQ